MLEELKSVEERKTQGAPSECNYFTRIFPPRISNTRDQPLAIFSEPD